MRRRRLLKAAILASVMAMSVCGSAWAVGTVDVDGYDYANDIVGAATPNSGVMYDGGWYAPDGKFYTYVNANGNIGDTLIQCSVSDGVADLTTAQRDKIISMGLDHNQQADAVSDNDNVPSYLDIMGGDKFKAANVAQALEDNLKFNSDLVRTVVQWEEADRKATDKFLNEQISQIDMSYNLQNNKLTLTTGRDQTNGNPVTTTIELNGLVEATNGILFENGKLNMMVADRSGEKVTGEVDISGYVNTQIENNAGGATYITNTDGSKVTINDQIAQNVTNIQNNTTAIQNINKNNVTNIAQTDEHTWTVTQYVNGESTPVTIKDTTLVSSTNGIGLSEQGMLSLSVVDTDNNSVTGKVDIGGYIKKNAGDAYYSYVMDENGNITSSTTIKQAITNNANDITNINNTIGNTTELKVDSDNLVTAINNTYTEAKKHTTAEAGKNIEVTLTETDGQKNYTIATKNDVSFNSVKTNVLYADNIYSNAATINTIHATNIYSDAVGTKVLYSDNIYSDAATIGQIYSEYAESKQVVTEKITLKDGDSSTDVVYDGDSDRIVYGDKTIATLNDGMKYGADIGNTIDLDLNQQLNILGGKNITTVSDSTGAITVDLDDEVKGLTLVESTTVKATTVNTTDINVNNQIKVGDKVTITENGMNINNKVVVEENNINVGGNTINNVAAGEISQNSTQAINGSQLYATNQRIEKLNGRVDKVGAGAAALAALHPLDFDPDDKLSFSAGVGNYGGETATALGMFYRPTEKVMFSAGGTMGNGENMVNMGVTFALDRTNNVSNTRTAMAKEIEDLRKQVAALTNLVAQLAGYNNPALKDVVMFPDVPENHWAYDYIESLQKHGIIEGYPDGNFGGDRSMTRYEYAAMLWRALERGFPVDERLLQEFDAELGRIRIDRIKGEDNDPDKTERVRVNHYADRDDYGSVVQQVSAK